MPQFDTSQYPSLIFWMLVNAALLVGVLVGYYIPKFGKILSNRKAKASTIAESNSMLQSQITAIEKEYAQLIATARNEAVKIISESKKSAKERYQNQLSMLDEEFRTEIKAINTVYLKKQHEIEDDLDQITHEAVEAITHKLTGKK